MLTLNRPPARRCLQFDVHGCTDVTGFGLIGHAREMALASGVTFEIEADAVCVPARRGGICAAGRDSRRPEEQSRIRILRGGERRDIPREIDDLLYDPQTSGGLLITLPEADAAALERAIHGGLPHRPRRCRAERRPIRLI